MSPRHLQMRLCAGQTEAASERAAFNVTFSELVGSDPKGDVDSVVTRGLKYLGTTFLFPLECFKVNMLSNQTQSCSEETRTGAAVKQH